jgi:hypothetical protein
MFFYFIIILKLIYFKNLNRVKNVSRIRKKTVYLQFCIETPGGHQKSIFSTSKLKRSQ